MGALKLGIVGCGVIASAHASALQGLRRAGFLDAEIAVVHDADVERARRFGAHVGAGIAASAEDVAQALTVKSSPAEVAALLAKSSVDAAVPVLPVKPAPLA